MRIAFQKLALALALGAAAVVVGSGCGIAFQDSKDGKLRFALGDVEPTCDVDTTVDDENGRAEVTHTVSDDQTRCTIHVEWSGVLVDMAAVRETTEAQIEAGGLPAANVAVRFKNVTVTLAEVRIRDDAGNDVQPPQLPSYDARVGIEGEGELLQIVHAEGGDPLNPTVSGNPNSDALLDLANKQYEARGTILANGSADVVLFTADLAALDAADQPALEMRLDVAVDGEASPKLF